MFFEAMGLHRTLDLNSNPMDSTHSGTLRSMTIKRHGHLFPTRVTSSQLAISPATYTSDCDSTSSGRHNLHHENINLT